MAPPQRRRDQLAGLAALAFRSFIGTFVVVFLGGAALAAVSAWFLQAYPLAAAIAVVCAIVETVAAAMMLASKRTLFLLLAQALRDQGLGRLMVRLLFERMLALAGKQGSEDRPGWVAQQLSSVPLAQAEGVLNQAVITWMATGQKSWLRRRIEQRLLGGIRLLTLARFRSENAEQGGVDLVKVQDELEAHVEERLIARLRTGLQVAMALVIIGLPAVVAGQTYLLLLFFQRQ